MWQRIWWRNLAGVVAGLVMLACALGLTYLCQRGCLQPFIDLSLPSLLPAQRLGAVSPATLAPGVMVHEAVAIALALLGSRILAPLARPLAGTLWLLGGSLSMVLFDSAVLAWRTPDMPVMLNSAQSLQYLAFGLVLAAWMLLPGLSRVAAGAVAPLRRGGKYVDDWGARPRLEVLIAPHCFGSERAYLLADEARRRFPAIEVCVVDLERTAARLPPGVVAVPAYVLNDRLLFTGNPTAETLLQALARAAGATDAPGTEQR
jgi:hypothetical protein